MEPSRDRESGVRSGGRCGRREVVGPDRRYEVRSKEVWYGACRVV